MEGIEQGRLKLSGIPCAGPPFFLWISLGFNRHGQMKARVWVPEEAGKGIPAGTPVTLEQTGENAGPIFCGVVRKSTAGKEKGQDCLYIEAETGSSLLDREKRNRSFQRKGRSYQELVGEAASPYQGYPVWKKGAGGERECGFLLQYEETDWEFIRRAASATGNGVLPESRFPGKGFYIGLPDSQGENRLEAGCYSIRSRIPGSILEDGTISTGPEYVIKESRQTLYPGDRVRFRGQYLAVAEKESRLAGGVVINTYTLRGEDSFRAAPIYNYRLIGASIAGTVEESSPDKSRLKLSTDKAGEAADSWHSRPIFYSGGGAGYSGRPEQGDTLHLYFPAEREEARSVIGGGGAGYEALHTVTQQIMDDTAAEEEEAQKSQPLPLGVESREPSSQGTELFSQGTAAGRAEKADASNMTGYKNWSTPGKQGVSLNPSGIRLQTGSGMAMGMGSGGISLSSRGDIGLTGKNGIEIDMLSGKRVSLKAEEYLYIQCGMSAAALLPDEIHLKGTRVQLDSPENEAEETVFADSRVEMLREAYYNDKWGSPLQLFMPDGTAIGREKGLEENAALRKYFTENVLNTEGYVNYLDNPKLDKFYEDGILDSDMKEGTEKSLYLRWLSATYGKTEMEKAGDWLVSKDGRHAALDTVGIFLDVADGVNAVLYLMESDWGNAGLSGISVFPLIGDYFGKGGKGAKYALKAADLTKLNRNKKVIKVLDNLDVFIKARKADLGEVHRLLRESWENLMDGERYAERYVTPDGLVYWVRTSDDFRVNINLMDEAGDTLQETWQAGKKVDDIGGLAGDAAKGNRIPNRTSPSKKPDILATPEGPRTKINYADPDLDNIRSLMRENEAADILAKNGYHVKQNPIVPGSKNPDYLIEGQVFDCYSPKDGTGIRNIASNMAEKVERGQTERIILNLDDWHGGGGNIDELINQLNEWPIPGLKEVKVINHYHEVIDIYP